ncbi:MAG: DUF805 domain-containing protein [Rhodospirillaceae bacterium]|nr:DUF805 domain-containing protein [Rhodospirillaceae bacterium]
MDFVTAIKTGLSKSITVQGRAVRSEYWFFMLFTVIADVVIQIVGGMLGELGLYLAIIGLIAVAIPSVTATVRRLHDMGRSGWWYFIVMVPMVGPILLVIWLCKPSEAGANRFGEPALTAVPVAA